MVTLQIPLQKKTVKVLKSMASKYGMTVELFLAERLNQAVTDTNTSRVDAVFRKIVQDSIQTNRELLKKLAE